MNLLLDKYHRYKNRKMSRFGDLIAGNVDSDSVESAPVTPVPAPPSVEVEPEVGDYLPDNPPEVSNDLEDLSKKELEEYGRTIGIELDRRHSKGKLIQELNEFKDSK